MTTKPATKTQILAHYAKQGKKARITKSGYVEFRDDDKDPWLDGRWASEYRIDTETGQVNLT